MQDPRKDIGPIFRTLRTTKRADELEETVMRHFTPDAKLSLAMCKAYSRNEVLGVFQWYRLASPDTQIDISNTMYDTDSNVVILDVTEKPKIWFNPFPSKGGKMLVRMQLKKMSGNYYIAAEEHLTNPMDQAEFIASPLVPFVAVCLSLSSIALNLGACVLRSMGLNSGLQGGSVSYAGVMEATGLKSGHVRG